VNSQWGGKAVARFKGGSGFSANLAVAAFEFEMVRAPADVTCPL